MKDDSLPGNVVTTLEKLLKYRVVSAKGRKVTKMSLPLHYKQGNYNVPGSDPLKPLLSSTEL